MSIHIIIRFLKGLRRDLFKLRMLVPWMRNRHRFEFMVGPLGFWDELQKYQLNALVANGLKPTHALLDIGCGPLQGGIAFINYLDRFNYVGIDLEKSPIDAAHFQIAKAGLSDKNPVLLVSDTFGNNVLGDRKFDFFWASQNLYIFDENLINSLMKTLQHRMNPGGKFLGDIISPKHYEFKHHEHGWILHTESSINNIIGKFGFKAKSLGEINQYGYPKRLSLNTNILIEIMKT